MGIGRDAREQELERQHDQHIEDIENSEMPGWVHEMYNHPFHKKMSKRSNVLYRVRLVSRIILVGIILGVLTAFVMMIKSC